ncbi:DNA polymerase III subunit delta [candidate division CPR3 bacterium 4484_211]|uniref:DNA-directed DNA polymerase n=1 Tax=candidate division CPR3 bacterium 4484_211 TaxID=1968527 RepID=A0A1W9NYW8_UNCC3|nr:MAG: DNA polymerase III subunit delta [candidate division CPR3 bacterium 4484_211]
MIHLIYGQDSYRAKKEIDSLAEKFSGKRIIFGEDLETINLDQLFRQQSLFGKQPLIVFRDILRIADQKGFMKIRDLHGGAGVVFWETGEVDRRLRLVKWLLKNARVKKFTPLKINEVRKWIYEYLSEKEIESAAVEMLIDHHGNNLILLEQELKKLQSYTDGRAITLSDIDQLCVRSVEANIFSFVDALSVGDQKKAGQLLSNLLDEGQDPWYLFSMIVRQFRLLILSHFKKGLKGQHPFVVQKIRQQAGRWEIKRLKKVYECLLGIDAGAKTGQKDLETELWLLLAELHRLT